MAVQDTPQFQPLEIISDSRYAIDSLTDHLCNWEDKGWIKVQNKQLFKRAAFLLKRRSAMTTFTWTKGHRGTLGNEESNKLAKEGAESNIPEALELSIPTEYNLQGAKLSTISQSTAYQGIMEKRHTPPRHSTQENLRIIKVAIEQTNGTMETEAIIWKNNKKPVLRTRVQQFLFKTIHKAFMIGKKWNDIWNFEHRATCKVCGETESMNHIIINCNAIERHLIWAKAKEMWPHDPQQWPTTTIGTVIGIGSIAIPHRRAQQGGGNNAVSTRSKSKTRLLQILISEASHLIWVLRCERAIRGKQHTVPQIKARWIKAINNRLTTDRIMATKIKRDLTFSKLVNGTWKATLKRRNIPHQNWLHRLEVFSG